MKARFVNYNVLLYSKIESTMPFEKGKNKTGGREAGTPNRAVKELRQQLQGIVQTTLDELPDTLAAMDPTDRARLLTALLPYIMPKLNSIELRTEQQDRTAKEGTTPLANAPTANLNN